MLSGNATLPDGTIQTQFPGGAPPQGLGIADFCSESGVVNDREAVIAAYSPVDRCNYASLSIKPQVVRSAYSKHTGEIVARAFTIPILGQKSGFPRPDESGDRFLRVSCNFRPCGPIGFHGHASPRPARLPARRRNAYASNSTAPLVKPPPKPTRITLSPRWMRPFS